MSNALADVFVGRSPFMILKATETAFPDPKFAGQGPYRRSPSHFHTIFRPAGLDKISLHKTECMVDALGERLEAQRQQEIEELFAHDGSVAVANKITGTMLVCIDAGKVPTKGNERVRR